MQAELHVITFLGFKGGVGRTTCAATLASGLADLGYHVALIDAGFAVPLQEPISTERRGRGSPPERSPLSKWAESTSIDPDAGGRIQLHRGRRCHLSDKKFEVIFVCAGRHRPTHSYDPRHCFETPALLKM